MKTKWTVFVLTVLLSAGASIAQTADDWVSQGRAYLAATNLGMANNCFSNAVRLAANHQAGNALYAFTRLRSLGLQPVGSNFLNRLGLPAADRDVLHWTALPPRDTNGVPFAPPGVASSREMMDMAHTNVMAEIIAAEANLARITDPIFQLSLSANETRLHDVTLDLGDIAVLRAMLHAAEFSAYNVCSWNLDVQFGVLRALYDAGQLSTERVLHDYPALLTFNSTNELIASRTAFKRGVDCYLAGSVFIRSNREPNAVRLFNLEVSKLDDEAKFRQTLIDLTNSFTGPVVLTEDNRYTFNLGAHFAGRHTPRSLLPAIRDDGFGLETFPDPTLGGVIWGLDPYLLDGFFAHFLKPIPTISPIFTRTGLQLGFPINTLRGHGYVVEVSTNLANWTFHTAFVNLEDGHWFNDPGPITLARRFYRVVDRTENMPAPPNDNFADRIQLSGLGITTTGYNLGATTEPGEPGWAWATVWWTWTAPVSGKVAIGTAGSTGWPMVNVFTGNSLGNLASVGNPFYATAGTTYQIQVGGSPGGIQLQITAPPVLLVSSPANPTVLLQPGNVLVSAMAADFDGSIDHLGVYVDGELLVRTTNTYLSTTWSNVPIGDHRLDIVAVDNLRVSTWSNISVTVRPPNDNFANRIRIPGLPATVYGTNDGGSMEPGEPNHANAYGGHSVWWTWTPSASGYVTISADLTADWGGHFPALAVYTGSAVSSLIAVASSVSLYDGPAQISFYATAGTAYQIAVDGQYGFVGRITLSLLGTRPPTVAISSPTNGAVFYGASTIPLVAAANDPDGSVARVDFYVDGSWSGARTNAPFTLLWTNAFYGGHSVYAMATDNLGAFGYSDFVFFECRYPETTLSLDIPIYNLSGAQGSQTYFVVNVPSNTWQLNISTWGGSGDCDLYVSYGHQPSLYSWDYRPYMHGNEESVTIFSPTPGDWHIMLHGWNWYSGVALQAY